MSVVAIGAAQWYHSPVLGGLPNEELGLGGTIINGRCVRENGVGGDIFITSSFSAWYVQRRAWRFEMFLEQDHQH